MPEGRSCRHPCPAPVIDELARTAQDPANHRYPTDEEKGMLAYRQAVATWYSDRYRVTLDPATEVLALIGSKEGCHHFVLARVNSGDPVLMTDPGYPAYRASILMAGGEPVVVAEGGGDDLVALAGLRRPQAHGAAGMAVREHRRTVAPSTSSATMRR